MIFVPAHVAWSDIKSKHPCVINRSCVELSRPSEVAEAREPKMNWKTKQDTGSGTTPATSAPLVVEIISTDT